MPPIHPIGHTNRKGRNNTLTRRARRSRQPVRDRRRDRRPRRDPPRARDRRGLPRARRDGQRARPRHRPGPRDQLLARPPVAQGAPGVVLPPPRRDAQVRREPAQEVPGHLQRQLRLRRLAQPVGRAAGRRAPLGRSRREGLPRRQPAHQALRLLGVAHQGDPRDRPRRDLPGRGLHPALGHARAGQDRLHAELHVLHLEERRWELVEYVNELAHGAEREYFRPNFFLTTPDILTDYLAEGGPPAFPDPPHPGRHAEPELRRLLGLRALRARPAPGQRGVPRQREVRAQAARARRPAAGDDPAPELRAPREPRAPAPGQRRLPGRRQRRDHRLRQARRAQRHHLRGEPRPPPRPGGPRPGARTTSACRPPSPPRTCSTARPTTGAWGATTCAWTPASAPATSCG